MSLLMLATEWAGVQRQKGQYAPDELRSDLLAAVQPNIAATRIQRTWRAGYKLAMVGMGVEDQDVMLQVFSAHVTFVRARTEKKAEYVAARTAPQTLEEVNVKTGSMDSPGFICWVDKMAHGKWHHLCEVSGDTLGRGLSGSIMDLP